MILLALIPGLLLPGALGWMLVRVLEGRSPVLWQAERILLGLLVGLTGGMFAVFLAHEWLGVPLSLLGFIGVILALGLVLGGTMYRYVPDFLSSPTLPRFPVLPRWSLVVITVLLGWTLLKLLSMSIMFLIVTPAYLDDTVDNWNLRGKVYYETGRLELVMPNEDPILSPRGVSSYPPTVPLVKTWLATLGGRWSDMLVNSVHMVWFIIAVGLLFFMLLRFASLPWALVGTYLITSLPLYVMHGTNTYADAFLSAHVFAAASLLFAALQERRKERMFIFLRLSALCMALLPFTKNEGLLVYLPPLLLLAALLLLWRWRRGALSLRDVRVVAAWFAVPLLCVAGPWLAFKWWNGLTFGNAKPFTSLGLGWQPMVFYSIVVNTLFEGNWLFLFILLPLLLVWQRRRAFGPYLILTAFFLIVYLGQGFLYHFTSLSHEALMQTGYARGLIHLIPTIILLTTLLLKDASPPLVQGLRSLAALRKMGS